MGHRANLIVVRGGRYDLWYSHWSANTLDRDLFWGPEHAVAFVEVQQPCGEDGWLDDVWAEGGAVIDTDAHVFRMFGGEDMQYDVPLRRLYLALLGEVWGGWNVGWADEGIADLADYVGHPRERVLAERTDDDVIADFEPPEEPGWVDCVASVRFADDTLRLFPLANDPTEYLLSGSSLLESVAPHSGQDRLALAEQTSEFPRGGFHLDFAPRRLTYWTAADQPGVQARIAERWPGWEVDWVRDRYEVQLTSTAGMLTFPARSPATLFGQLRSMLLREQRRSPVEGLLRIAEQDRAEGKSIQINPYALRDDRIECPIDVRARTLNRAAVQLGLNAI